MSSFARSHQFEKAQHDNAFYAVAPTMQLSTLNICSTDAAWQMPKSLLAWLCCLNLHAANALNHCALLEQTSLVEQPEDGARVFTKINKLACNWSNDIKNRFYSHPEGTQWTQMFIKQWWIVGFHDVINCHKRDKHEVNVLSEWENGEIKSELLSTFDKAENSFHPKWTMEKKSI